MTYILHIETSTKACSVALAKEGELIAIKEESDQNFSHAQKLTLFIDELIKETGIGFDKINAVCVSKGPGSYTGLRIGVSAAKGICFAKDIPLISVDSMHGLAQYFLNSYKKEISEKTSNTDFYICPMVDARRMEIYSAVFDKNMSEIVPTNAVIIDESSFKELIEERTFFIFGDGAEKCKEVMKHPNLEFIPNVDCSAKGLIQLAYKKYLNKDFENTAYFEPFYLKDFVAGKPRVKGLYD